MTKKKREEITQAIAKERTRQREEALLAKPAAINVVRATVADPPRRRKSKDSSQSDPPGSEGAN